MIICLLINYYPGIVIFIPGGKYIYCNHTKTKQTDIKQVSYAVTGMDFLARQFLNVKKL
ncbi:hypothetical protein Xinn_02906 [Xenorhabdus innexi]|uniref:Transposase n=1 Tax=Xenorhabdus innexi TaxID=290109 RepID=A0A2G0N951_9GAMM|nr:hypothetical protein Xinn_02906 [Xenorhabdus innexi]